MTKRFGFRSSIWQNLTIEQAAAELKSIGYDCLELCLERPDVRPETLTEARCREIADMLAGIGIGLASVSYHADAEPLDTRRENQRRAVQVTRWLGAGILILNGEKVTDHPRQWAEHVERLRALCQRAEEADIVIAIEPEPLLVIGSSQEMAEMIAEVGSPRLKVNLDIGHAQITDPDLAATIRQLGSTIVHLHLEDIHDRVHKHLPFGAGNIDFDAVRQALQEIAYDGPYVADLFGQAEEPTIVATQALTGMRRLFGE